MMGRAIEMSGVRRGARRARRGFVAVLLAATLSVNLSSRAAQAAESQKRHLACSRGNLAVCEALVGQARIAPGVRAAAEQLLVEVHEGAAACDGGEVPACTELLDRYPDLPALMREGIAAALARANRR